MPPSKSADRKNKKAVPLLRALTAENKRLQSRNIALEAKNISLTNRIEALEEKIRAQADGSLQELVGQIFRRAGARKVAAKQGSKPDGHS